MIGVISILIGIGIFFITNLWGNTLQELKNENSWSKKINIYEIWLSILGFVIVGIFFIKVRVFCL